ncbi:methyltransferase domain-containing protein [Parvularcula dongshanensis]|uniref:SAM-dependent methyltransferase n=1 Tax=Parvularcula dongshanensis TaxID=1173995 RepID=A0A840I2A3_9PROT|nr:methyltransferase domain-containing protein [Parvularcula dongshanensis]MBB4658949.1 SAM-dependent methyltransferase [Parvularcula dongshanensis]
MRTFLANATNARGDTRPDRLLAIFAALRASAEEGTWHNVAGLKAFLQDIADWNPYVPPSVAARVGQPSPRSKLSFQDAWRSAGLAMRDERIKVSDLEATIRAEPLVAEQFARRNLHDQHYYYSKYLEWHISITALASLPARRVVDLGAAYDGFARVARVGAPTAEIIMVDLCFPTGLHAKTEGIVRYGTDAADLSELEDASIDLVVSHNAFEHFMGGADAAAITEAARVLRPGGQLIITPFFASAYPSVTIQPFSAFVASNDAALADAIEEEAMADGVIVRFNHQIISPFARGYDFATFSSRLLPAAGNMTPMLRRVRLEADASGGAHVADGITVDSLVFTQGVPI